MTVNDKILEFLKQIGPTLPTKVAKNIDSSILMASAHLADLVSQKKVSLSSLKIGGSPLYYLPGQEEQLFDFAAGNMNPKNYVVLEKLKEEKVLKESDLDLLEKVALRSLKDFAVPLQVRTEEKVELFWRWHILSKDETNELVAEILGPKKEEQKISELTEPAEAIEPIEAPELSESEESLRKEPGSESGQKTLIEPQTSEVSKSDAKTKEIKKEDVKENLKLDDSKNKNKDKEEVQNKNKEKEESLKDKKKDDLQEEESSEEEKKEEIRVKKLELEELLEKKSRKKRVVKEEQFLPVLETFFKGLEISIQKKELIRKNSEMNFLISVPSAVGSMTYFCKAKSKKKCDEKDVSSAYMEAQIKKLPLLFLYSNELGKKATEMLKSDAFENAIVRKIE